MTESLIRLHYFDGYGEAEAIRMLLATKNIPFEDVRYTGEEFLIAQKTGAFEFGEVPALEMDGVLFSKRDSILRMLGRQHGLYPVNDHEAAWEIDSILESSIDFRIQFFKATVEAEPKLKEELMHNFVTK